MRNSVQSQSEMLLLLCADAVLEMIDHIEAGIPGRDLEQLFMLHDKILALRADMAKKEER